MAVISKKANKQPPIRSHFVVGIGFAILMIWLVLAGLFTIQQLRENRMLTVELISAATTKSRLLDTLRHIAREREERLFVMVDTPGAFEIDGLKQQFSSLASEFLVARRQYDSLPHSDAERAQFARTLEGVRVAAASQQEVIQLIDAGNTLMAYSMLFKQVVPAQAKVMRLYSELIDLQQKETESAIATMNRKSLENQEQVGLLVGMTLFTGMLVVSIVIRRTSEIEENLQREKELAQVTLHSIADGILTTDQYCRVNFANPSAVRLLGWRADEVRGMKLSEVLHAIDPATGIDLVLPDPMQPEDYLQLNAERMTVLGRFGDAFSVRMTASLLQDMNGEMMGAVLAFQDMTEAHRLQTRLAWQASHDQLTSLKNRYGFEADLARVLETGKTDRQQHVMMVLDLDQFKVVNDTCGHLAGDQLLVQVGLMIEAHVRRGDVVARLGGDEFGVLLENCQLEIGERVAEKIRKELAEYRFSWEDKFFTVGVSIGVVPLTMHTGSPSQAISAADAACYVAKQHGRNRVHVLRGDEEIAQKHTEMQWVARIGKAIDEGRLQLYFQRIVPLAAGCQEEEHCEVLVRMLDEEGKVVPPGVFIPPAERYNFMPTVDRWVVRTLFSRLAAQPTDKYYAINLSAQSIGDPEFHEFLLQQLGTEGVKPNRLCFEITETSAIAQMGVAQRLIAALQLRGCTFALDDFGSGMSSYAYLKNLKVDYLKIDGALVRDTAHDTVDFTMVESIHRIGCAMGIKTIAEFVENQETLDCLRRIGVNYAQGYFIHQPEPM